MNRDCAKHFDSLEVEEDLEELLGDSLIEEMDIKKNEIWMKWLRQPRREWLDKVQVYLRDSFADL